MKIGSRTFTPRRPADLDTILLTEFGCDAAEISTLLAGSPLAGTVARALLPFMPEKDRPDAATLADEIAAIGVASVAAEVRSLYAQQAAASEIVE